MQREKVGRQEGSFPPPTDRCPLPHDGGHCLWGIVYLDHRLPVWLLEPKRWPLPEFLVLLFAHRCMVTKSTDQNRFQPSNRIVCVSGLAGVYPHETSR